MSMCEAAFDLGPAVDQKGMFALAETRFTDAITGAPAARPDEHRERGVRRSRARSAVPGQYRLAR